MLEKSMPEPEKTKVELKISGMHCATCAINIEESLSQVQNVSKVQVNFGTDTARVEFDPKKVLLTELEKAVKDVGYDVVNREVTLKIGGMVCATCVQTIESALRALHGCVCKREPRHRESIRHLQPLIISHPGYEKGH
jgi:Cu+-exporting ATPase